MRQLLYLAAAAALIAATGPALAHNCPNEMKAIDAKMSSKPALSKDNADKVAKLRAEGETFHKAGKHAESMKALGDAKKILGI